MFVRVHAFTTGQIREGGCRKVHCPSSVGTIVLCWRSASVWQGVVSARRRTFEKVVRAQAVDRIRFVRFAECDFMTTRTPFASFGSSCRMRIASGSTTEGFYRFVPCVDDSVVGECTREPQLSTRQQHWCAKLLNSNPLRPTLCHKFQQAAEIGLGVRGSLVRIQSSRPIFKFPNKPAIYSDSRRSLLCLDLLTHCQEVCCESMTPSRMVSTS